MKSVLIVENSRSIAESISSVLQRELDLRVETANSLAQARERIADSKEEFAAGVFGLVLEDATGVEVVDFAIANNIPPIIFSGTMQPEVRRQLWARDIVDYVVKESPESLRQIVRILGRLTMNVEFPVLVADSRPQLMDFVARLLERHRFPVHRAASEEEATRIMAEIPNMRLLLMGDTLQGTGALGFVEACRQRLPKEELAILTLCQKDRTEVAVDALKRGADDFLTWPFTLEEFYSRVNNARDTLALLGSLSRANRTDFLTGVFNRRHLMALMESEYQRSLRHGRMLSLIMLDADKFKNVNDTYGHNVGDMVLVQITETVRGMIRGEDSVGRFGGEEFVIVLPETDRDMASMAAERIRAAIAEAPVLAEGESVTITVSLGVATLPREGKPPSLKELLHQADEALYHAKETGRNKVVHREDLAN